jgi:cobalt/nickel transport system ATP-binding protein
MGALGLNTGYFMTPDIKTATEHPIIHIHDLAYAYEDGTPALQGVDLHIERGESVALVGPNAAGKSTLLLHLNGFLRGSDTIRICGKAITDDNLPLIRSQVGMVFQEADHQLFMLKVFEDVAFGPMNMGLSEDEVRTRVTEALTAVNLRGYEERAPHHLSGGEKRAVAIATVIAMRPEVLVMDEPSANLDPRTRRKLIALLNGMDITKLVASHDLTFVLETCERTIVLDDGRTVADGPTRELLASRDLMEQHGLEVPPGL